MLDIIAAVSDQDIFMMHIVDAVEAINRDHTGNRPGRQGAGRTGVAGMDPVATDLFCARYMFSNVGLKEAEEAGLDDGAGGRFPQAVPLPLLKEKAIITTRGYDCPLSRDFSFERAEKRGLGRRLYYVVGGDDITGQPLASFRGRLGYLDGDNFKEIVTTGLVYRLAQDALGYAEDLFRLLGCRGSIAGDFIEKKFSRHLRRRRRRHCDLRRIRKKRALRNNHVFRRTTDELRAEENESESFRAIYALMSNSLRCSNPEWNPEGHHINREQIYGSVCVVAQLMSLSPKEQEDPFVPGLMWGKGKWPSYSLAYDRYLKQLIFGFKYPARVGIACLYGMVCTYADFRQNDRKFMGQIARTRQPQGAADVCGSSA